MAKNKKSNVRQQPLNEDKPTTLKDLLNPQILEKLKQQSDQMKAEEEQRKEEQRKQVEDARKVEKKRLENDFEHLLNNSSVDWKKFK